MKAWICHSLDGENSLRYEEQQQPECGDEQILLRTHYVALNYPDTLLIRGQYQLKLDPPFVPGSELAGEVIAVGSEVSEYEPGQRVMALTGFGALAEEVLVAPPMQQIHALPDAMPFEQAAAFNMVYGTAMLGLKQRAQLQPGETVLVLGAAGGCGSAAVQIAKAMGACVIAGASSAEKRELARAAGADETLDYSDGALRDKVKALTDGKGVDVVFDPVGDELGREALRTLGWNGRYLVVGFAGGDIPELAFNYTILKSISLVGVAYGMSAIADPATNQANFKQLFDWYQQGLVKPAIGRVYATGETPLALAELYAGKALGKSIIRFPAAS